MDEIADMQLYYIARSPVVYTIVAINILTVVLLLSFMCWAYWGLDYHLKPKIDGPYYVISNNQIDNQKIGIILQVENGTIFTRYKSGIFEYDSDDGYSSISDIPPNPMFCLSVYDFKSSEWLTLEDCIGIKKSTGVAPTRRVLGIVLILDIAMLIVEIYLVFRLIVYYLRAGKRSCVYCGCLLKHISSYRTQCPECGEKRYSV